jgi:hypothetical protein
MQSQVIHQQARRAQLLDGQSVLRSVGDSRSISEGRGGYIPVSKTRDLIKEEFAEIDVTVSEYRPLVTLHFADMDAANRAYFVIKNALELGIPIQIRTPGGDSE